MRKIKVNCSLPVFNVLVGVFGICYNRFPSAGVAKLVDALDSKSSSPLESVGSTPSSGIP